MCVSMLTSINVYSMRMLNEVLHKLNKAEGNHYKYFTSFHNFFNKLQSIICTGQCICFLLFLLE